MYRISINDDGYFRDTTEERGNNDSERGDGYEERENDDNPERNDEQRRDDGGGDDPPRFEDSESFCCENSVGDGSVDDGAKSAGGLYTPEPWSRASAAEREQFRMLHDIRQCVDEQANAIRTHSKVLERILQLLLGQGDSPKSDAGGYNIFDSSMFFFVFTINMHVSFTADDDSVERRNSSPMTTPSCSSDSVCRLLSPSVETLSSGELFSKLEMFPLENKAALEALEKKLDQKSEEYDADLRDQVVSFLVSLLFDDIYRLINC